MNELETTTPVYLHQWNCVARVKTVTKTCDIPFSMRFSQDFDQKPRTVVDEAWDYFQNYGLCPFECLTGMAVRKVKE
jgi:hypothetical protein